MRPDDQQQATDDRERALELAKVIRDLAEDFARQHLTQTVVDAIPIAAAVAICMRLDISPKSMRPTVRKR